jgi:predicted nuclease with TOPRIM domain
MEESRGSGRRRLNATRKDVDKMERQLLEQGERLNQIVHSKLEKDNEAMRMRYQKEMPRLQKRLDELASELSGVLDDGTRKEKEGEYAGLRKKYDDNIQEAQEMLDRHDRVLDSLAVWRG